MSGIFVFRVTNLASKAYLSILKHTKMNSNHASITLKPGVMNDCITLVIGRKSKVNTHTVFLPVDAHDIRLRGVKHPNETKTLWQLFHDEGTFASFYLWGDEPPYFVNANDFPEDNKPYVVENILYPVYSEFKTKLGHTVKSLN